MRLLPVFSRNKLRSKDFKSARSEPVPCYLNNLTVHGRSGPVSRLTTRLTKVLAKNFEMNVRLALISPAWRISLRNGKLVSGLSNGRTITIKFESPSACG